MGFGARWSKLTLDSATCNTIVNVYYMFADMLGVMLILRMAVEPGYESYPFLFLTMAISNATFQGVGDEQR